MKKMLTVLCFSFFMTSVFAAGIFEYYLNTNLANYGNYSGGTSFSGATLATGLDLNSATLYIDLGGIKTWEDGNDDIVSSTLHYRVYEQGTTAPSFSTQSLPQFGGQVGNNREFQNGTDINLLAGLTSAATYVVDLYFTADGTYPTGSFTLYEPAMGTWHTATFTVTTALPIELTTFTAKNDQNQVNLAWETASELNNDRFEIERSATGRDWKTIATQKSQNADSNVPQNYAFEDKNPLRGTNYYRLRQVDIDGTTSYSKVLMVDFGKTSTSVVAFPNPVIANQVTLTFEEDKADASIRIFDNQGRLVRQINTDIQENQQMYLDLSDLPSGILYLQVGEGDITRLVRN